MAERLEVKFANADGDVVWAIVPGDIANAGEMVTDTRGPVHTEIRVIDDVTVTEIFVDGRTRYTGDYSTVEVHLYADGRVTIGVMAFPYEVALHADEYARVGLPTSLDHLTY